jgi:hypothetical protein
MTIAQMREVLRPDKGWRDVAQAIDAVHGRGEHILEWGFKKYPGVILRVYTSIDRATGVARDKGNDAIRVCAVNTNTDRGLVKSKRVLRVNNWRANLKHRVWEVMNVVRAQRGDSPLPHPAKG